MAVTSVSELHKVESGEVELGKGFSFDRFWYVVTNDRSDKAQTVLSSTDLPVVGSFYVSGNDANIFSYLKKLRARRQKSAESMTRWLVHGKYAPIDEDDEDEQPDDQGEPTENPLEHRWEITTGTARFTTPALEGINREVFNAPGEKFHRAVDTSGPVTNTLGEVFIPPAERDESRWTLRFAHNETTFNGDTFRPWLDAINNDGFNVHLAHAPTSTAPPAVFFNLSVAAYEAKVMSISGDPRRQTYTDALGVQQVVDYYRIEVEMEIYPDGDWRYLLPNMSVSARAGAGDPDGKGGTLSAGDVGADDVGKRRLQDRWGHPMTEPTFIDRVTGRPQADEENLTYSIYKERDFLTFAFLQPVIQ